jgi:hypothetical protein
VYSLTTVNGDERQSNSDVNNWYITGPILVILFAVLILIGLWLNRHNHKDNVWWRKVFPGGVNRRDDVTNAELEIPSISGGLGATEDTKPPPYCEVMMDPPAYSELFDDEGKQLPKSTESDANS